MCNKIRSIQRAAKRTGATGLRDGVYFMGRGSRLGVNNPKDAALLARQARDIKHGRMAASATKPKPRRTRAKKAAA